MDLVHVRSMRTPRSRAELALAPGEALLGGGTYLFSTPQPPEVTGLVDLTAMGWRAVVPRDDGGLRLAATCTWAQLAAIPETATRTAAPLFRQAARALLASFKVWNTATVGGNMALAYPASMMTVLACALDATVRVWDADGGKRRVPAEDFVTGDMTTVLGPGDVLRAIDFPAAPLDGRTAFRSWSKAPLGRAAGMAAGRRDADGRLTVVLAGATTHPYVLRFDGVPEALELARAIDPIDTWFGDQQGALEWRRALSYLAAEEIRLELAEAA
ncbi:FAD binding domain-containing protein [Gryllotalpicola ginsengisoli]|uniref:FAD binding domain-containing protein n=1 Tax=Gryllotalpicola ginsengisoli TaxID=444608 RepID=UPI0003B465A1|nr:FAD binding domain-containing protein [Gryllotalpicola ginsengisoli]